MYDNAHGFDKCREKDRFKMNPFYATKMSLFLRDSTNPVDESTIVQVEGKQKPVQLF